jgi:sec-independent protein translocase protein TatA
MGAFGPLHWIVVLIVVVLIFGTKKLRNIGGDLGGAVKDFKDAMSKEQVAENKDANTSNTIEGEVTNKTKQ